MRKIHALPALLVVAAMAAPSFALVGIGGHWAPNFGAKIGGAKQTINTSLGDATFVRDEATIEQGFGFKLWLDLPVVPINVEATTNFQGGFYDATIETAAREIPLAINMGFPLLGEAEPMFGLMSVDLSVAWRFVDFNPALLRVQTYVGGGVTWNYATRPLDKKTAQTAFDAVYGSMDPAIAADEKAQAKAMQNALESAYGDLDSGFGGHVLLGARVKLLVFSVYVNGKYHFGGLPSGIDNGLTLELGGGLGL